MTGNHQNREHEKSKQDKVKNQKDDSGEAALYEQEQKKRPETDISKLLGKLHDV